MPLKGGSEGRRDRRKNAGGAMRRTTAIPRRGSGGRTCRRPHAPRRSCDERDGDDAVGNASRGPGGLVGPPIGGARKTRNRAEISNWSDCEQRTFQVKNDFYQIVFMTYYDQRHHRSNPSKARLLDISKMHPLLHTWEHVFLPTPSIREKEKGTQCRT